MKKLSFHNTIENSSLNKLKKHKFFVGMLIVYAVELELFISCICIFPQGKKINTAIQNSKFGSALQDHPRML